MADPPSDQQLDERRRRLVYRSRYTGMKETDLLLGPFADRHVNAFDAGQLDRYERLLEAGDPNIYDWATGRDSVPAEYDTDVMKLLREFRTK